MNTKYYKTYSSPEPAEFKDESLDKFISQRSGILSSKLEVLLQEIQARLAIRNKNIAGVDDDLNKVKEIMQALSPRAHYFGDTPEKEEFHKVRENSFDLEKERRDQDVSCWNDVVKVMQELMNTWEAHEQTVARAKLMKSGGLGKILDDTYSEKKEDYKQP